MSLSQKVQAIEEVFSLLDQEIARFQGLSGLACQLGCGKCCTRPSIEATVLEFLPLAYHLYHTQRAAEWLLRLQNDEPDVCVLLSESPRGGGFCSEYLHRGLICRLFGFSARTNKYALREFVTCQVIKIGQPIAYAEALDMIADGGYVPVMSHYYMRLLSIDPDLGKEFYPVNGAIRRAIETVLHYYAYQA